MKKFDQFVAVDWSGAEYPVQSKSICLSISSRGNTAPAIVYDVRSRSDVAAWILSAARENHRTLVGIDCNFGYSAHVMNRQFGTNADFRDLWRAVDETSQHHDNYFAGGFWTHPDYKNDFWTQGKKPEDLILQKRVTEIRCAEMGLGHPESPFKMIGPKQVGKGGLAGMRMVYDLIRRCPDIAVWPFDMEHVKDARVVVAEIYPRLFIKMAGAGVAKVRQAEDLNEILTSLNSLPYKVSAPLTDHQTDSLISSAGLRFLCGGTAQMLDKIAKPEKLNPAIARTEGWIWGVF